MDSRALTLSAASGLPGGTEYTDKQTTEAEKSETAQNEKVFADINGRKWWVTSTPAPFIKSCEICLADRLTSKAVCNSWDHTICDKCEPKILQIGKCPLCQGGIPNEAQRQIANDNLTRQLNNVELECQECPWKGTYRDIAVHIAHCRGTQASCEYFSMGCQHKGYRSDLEDHQLKCPYKPVECIYHCGQQVATLNLATHKEQCRKRPVTEGNLTTTFENMEGIKKIKLKFEQGSSQILALDNEEKDKLLKQCIDYFPMLAEAALASHPRAVPSASNTSYPCLMKCGQCFETRAERRYHSDQCPMALVTCHYEGCRSQVSRRELQVHMASCNYKPVPCRNGCGMEVSQSTWDSIGAAHFLRCPNVLCQYCDKGIPERELEQHLTQQCEKNKYNCTMCLTAVPFYQKNIHKAECPVSSKLRIGHLQLTQLPDATGPVYRDDNEPGYEFNKKKIYFVIPTEKIREIMKGKSGKQTLVFPLGREAIEINMGLYTSPYSPQGVSLSLKNPFFIKSDTYNGSLLSFKDAKSLCSLKNALDHSNNIRIFGYGGIEIPLLESQDFPSAEEYDEPYLLIEFRS